MSGSVSGSMSGFMSILRSQLTAIAPGCPMVPEKSGIPGSGIPGCCAPTACVPAGAEHGPSPAPDSAVLQRKTQFFDGWAPHYDCLLTTVFYQAIHQRLIQCLAAPPQSPVLDLGCGTGRLLLRLGREFPALTGVGLDLSSAMVAQAQALHRGDDRVQFCTGEATAIPFAEGHFGAVFNTFSFLHYAEPQAVLGEVSRVLRSGGYFYLVDPMVGSLGFVPFSPNGIRFYDRAQRQSLGAAAGLQCLGHVPLLSNAWLTIFTQG